MWRWRGAWISGIGLDEESGRGSGRRTWLRLLEGDATAIIMLVGAFVSRGRYDLGNTEPISDHDADEYLSGSLSQL